jgi:hypothetical protein
VVQNDGKLENSSQKDAERPGRINRPSPLTTFWVEIFSFLKLLDFQARDKNYPKLLENLEYKP